MNSFAGVYIGKDTRPSSVKLSQAAIDGVLALKGKPYDFGIVTTPMLHYFVTCRNTDGAYGEPSEEGYYNKLVKAFKNLRGTEYDNGNYVSKLLFDGANGVGAKKIKQFQEKLGDSLTIVDYNNAIIGSGKLNYMVSCLGDPNNPFSPVFVGFYSKFYQTAPISTKIGL